MTNRQLRDKETGKTLRLLPLAVDFRSQKRFSLGALRSAIRLSVLNSFRQAAQEARYEIGAETPSHTTVYRNFRDIFDGNEISFRNREFRYLMADTMKICLQAGRGLDGGWAEVRVVLGAQRPEGPWTPPRGKGIGEEEDGKQDKQERG
ncbi:hypothetical protein [Thermodesulfatator autotrophicus]|uniref:Uncharacterized protein n=1 Tax=Thermodesulfatator autotrophicus TaxID=1795632 RepID=A0A177E8W8_9BACT|nr:hypothetical protein TH606_01900 [Thermodesulfatator autotrophicus]